MPQQAIIPKAWFKNLIKRVQETPAVWNDKHPDYTNKTVLESKWQEIATHLDKDVSEVKRKWKKLRHRMRKELTTKPPKSSAWEHFEDMSFIRYVILQNDEEAENSHTSSLKFNALDDGHELTRVNIKIDSDYNFLTSLLEYMQPLTLEEKLDLREVLQKEVGIAYRKHLLLNT